MEVGHVNGHEEDSAQVNLIFWTCHRCNVRCGLTLQRARLGRRTRQFNPAAGAEARHGAHPGRASNAGQRANSVQGARTLGQWLTAVTSMKGEPDAMPVAAAWEMIRATPEERSRLAHQIWSRRRNGTEQEDGAAPRRFEHQSTPVRTQMAIESSV